MLKDTVLNFLKRIWASKKMAPPDIDRLLLSSNPLDCIFAVEAHVSDLSEHGSWIGVLNEPQANFYLNEALQREVNNGGFHLFYLNSAGDFAHETVEALREVGAHTMARIVEQANAYFPDGVVPRDREERWEKVLQIQEDTWASCDKAFYECDDPLDELHIRYIRKHKDAFKRDGIF